MSSNENQAKKQKTVTMQSSKVQLVNIFNKKNYTIFLKLKNEKTIVISPNGIVSKIEKSQINYDSIPEGIEIFI